MKTKKPKAYFGWAIYSHSGVLQSLEYGSKPDCVFATRSLARHECPPGERNTSGEMLLVCRVRIVPVTKKARKVKP